MVFIDYVGDGVKYADIKLNVLIGGIHNNIIDQVQFLLIVMNDFKDKAHNIYAIQREEEFITNSVSHIFSIFGLSVKY